MYVYLDKKNMYLDVHFFKVIQCCRTYKLPASERLFVAKFLIIIDRSLTPVKLDIEPIHNRQIKCGGKSCLTTFCQFYNINNTTLTLQQESQTNIFLGKKDGLL